MLSKDFFTDLFNTKIKSWIKEQRWFLDKSNEIMSIEIEDFFEIKNLNKYKIYGIICNIITAIESSSYFVPFIFLKNNDSKNIIGSIYRTDIDGYDYDILPAEHNVIYQRSLCKLFCRNKTLKTNCGNKVRFSKRSNSATDFFSLPIINSKNLLEGSNNTSSNMLTDIENKFGHMVIKSFKKGQIDIEMEMYEALAIEGFKNMPVLYAQSFLEFKNQKRIPLCIAIEKIKVPDKLSNENWKMKSGFIIADIFSRIVNVYSENIDMENKYGFVDNLMDENIHRSLDEENKYNLNIPDDLTYKKLLIYLGEIIAGFNISLANSKLECFGKSFADRDIINEKYIYELIISIEKKIIFVKDNLLFKKYFNESKDSIMMKADLIINSLPQIYISRIHGDMQLDQILFNEKFNLIIIDFGGAPVMGVNEKRARSPVFYDLAGLIRAFGYIKFYVLKKYFNKTNQDVFNSIINEQDNKFEKKSQIVKFSCLMEDIFKNILIKSYLNYLEDQNETSIIMDRWDRNICMIFIEYCTISRALYEINYELSARPHEENALIPLESIYKTLI